MDRGLYPKNWTDIANSIKDKAGWKCEQCGKPCRNGETVDEFISKSYRAGMTNYNRQLLTYDEWDEIVKKAPGRFVLTVAHLDHDPSNNSTRNLKALCSVCHLRYDAQRKADDRKKNPKKKKKKKKA